MVVKKFVYYISREGTARLAFPQDFPVTVRAIRQCSAETADGICVDILTEAPNMIVVDDSPETLALLGRRVIPNVYKSRTHIVFADHTVRAERAPLYVDLGFATQNFRIKSASDAEQLIHALAN